MPVRVLVGIPTHKGDIATSILTSLLEGGSQGGMCINYQVSGMSLLANNFNRIFCNAWNGNHDFLIMLHSDIGVQLPGYEGSWLDVLVRRTLELKAAALSCVVAIKTFDGLTSLAIQEDPINPYSFRRIAVRELARMPERFISRLDICETLKLDPAKTGPMLINTGVLCINLRQFPWAKDRFPGFQIHDIIEWNTKDVPQFYVIPEDWDFSRWMDGLGYPYYAIKDLIIEHHGGWGFVNRGLWGYNNDPHPRQILPEEYRKT